MTTITKDSFKDYKKYLSVSLYVYLFVLVILVIIKLVGLDYFGLDINNPKLIRINKFYLKFHLDYLWLFINLFLQQYFYISIVCKEKVKKIYPFIGFLITIICQLILMKYNLMNKFYFIFCTILFIVMPIIVKKKFMIKRQIIYIVLITLYQGLSLYIKNINFNYDYGNLLLDNILNLDQLLMLAITYNIIVKKGDSEIWELEVISSSLKKINLKKLLKKLQRNYSNFKAKNKQEKFTIILYFILSLIWNVLNVLLVLYVAMLNETFVECIFILSTFFISKQVFGKAFHLDSMCKCFIISNLTYYCLNRITTPIGISIFVPILLGVGLAYFTSKLAKKFYKPLYKGMPEDTFNETILQVVDKDSKKYKICYDFYMGNKSALVLSRKYIYTEAGIRKIISRVNDKIKELNK